VTADQIIWAAAIWHQMLDYRAKADAIFNSLAGKTLSPERQSLVSKAKQYYAWFDFLDAYRLALAASA
jgi:hypothetical protein